MKFTRREREESREGEARTDEKGADRERKTEGKLTALFEWWRNKTNLAL